jgi:site-specific recombinase XerC
VAVSRFHVSPARICCATAWPRSSSQRRPINEVADLLGHRSIDTTAIYVKVAVPQLADVALPFPGGAS